MSLVIDPDESLGVMREEIFGPILPVRTYGSVEEAIEYVNAGERPLGLYVFSADEQAAQAVLDRTISGGAAVERVRRPGGAPLARLRRGRLQRLGPPPRRGRVPGVLQSRAASCIRGEGGMLDAFLPPYGDQTQALLESIFGG